MARIAAKSKKESFISNALSAFNKLAITCIVISAAVFICYSIYSYIESSNTALHHMESRQELISLTKENIALNKKRNALLERRNELLEIIAEKK